MLKSAQRSNGTLEVYYKIMMITLVSESVREMVAYRGVTLLKMRRRKDFAENDFEAFCRWHYRNMRE